MLISAFVWCCSLSANAQTHPLKFKTHAGNWITVDHGIIKYNGKAILRRKYWDDIIDTNQNRIIEDGGSVFLFLAIDGRPNLDEYEVYKLTPYTAKLVANAMLSPIKDYDGDGYLEFGGSNLTEGYGNPDSMYYVPTHYFKIKNGEIGEDKALTVREDKKINGLYLPPNKQLDKDGNCCTVVPDPARKGKKTIVNNSPYLEKSFMPSDTITVSATTDVLNGQRDIVEAIHNYDGSWEFFGGNSTHIPATALHKVKLGVLVKLDKSILLLSWVQKGYFATRQSKNAPWGWNTLINKR